VSAGTATIARERCSTLSVGDFYARSITLPKQPLLIDISTVTVSAKDGECATVFSPQTAFCASTLASSIP
jgi:hypothetical protein